MQLSVIIVNYNVKYFLEQALLSARKAAKGLELEVWVVDNNSSDESVEMVREKFPEVKLIANQNNPGFSIANNQAIRQSKGKYVLLLNPDTVVEENTFSECIAFMDAHEDAGALGVKMIDGAGNFLPESKRGFPTPFVALTKTIGLSKLFPKSQLFNRYHLGFLDENQNHEVDVLAGAFMFMRREALDKVGLLDETFFMYGEDIDLSYRIVEGGYKNYYLADTSIIHYKGESTKKGSLNYVKAFYNAMIIFAKKHFKGEQARLFIWMLQLAIYFQAFITIIKNGAKRLVQPIVDALLIYGGLYFLKDFWARHYFNNPDYYEPSFMYFNVPLYILIWLGTVFFSGGYDVEFSIRKLVRGVFFGTLLLAAVYGFLDLEYRPSRALIVLGAGWVLVAMIGIRMLVHFVRYRNFNLGKEQRRKLVIVGTKKESERVLHLIHQAQVPTNFIGTVAATRSYDEEIYLNELTHLDEVIQLYKVKEIIFCSQDIAYTQIIGWMKKLGSELSYKIVPENSQSIIGSSSKNTPGELYTIDIQFRVASVANRRNKRLLDIFLAFVLLLMCPVFGFFIKQRISFFNNIWAVIWGRKSWVGYVFTKRQLYNLPSLKQGVLNPLDSLKSQTHSERTKERLNFLYAKDYTVSGDIEIVWHGFKLLGK